MLWDIVTVHGQGGILAQEVLEGTLDEVLTQVRYDVKEIQLMVDDRAVPPITEITITLRSN